jgi:hypothetical protein
MSKIQLDLIEIATTLRGDVPQVERDTARRMYFEMFRADSFSAYDLNEFLTRIKREYGFPK